MSRCRALCVRLFAARPTLRLPSWRAVLLLTLICMVTISSLTLQYLQHTRGNPPTFRSAEVSSSPEQEDIIWIDIRASSRPRKTILLYTPLQGTFTNWRRRFGDSFDGCRWSRCELTSDRDAYSQADAVIFSLWDLDPDDELPDAVDGQLWLLYEREAPPALSRRQPHLLNPEVAGRFHWTLSYHHDADIPVPYGAVLPLDEPPPVSANRSRTAASGAVREPRSGRTETTQQRAARRAAEEARLQRQWEETVGNRSASVVWVSSHCHTDSKRETYVQQLRQHIDVDVYGECGDLTCPVTKKGFCLRLFAQHYTFMLAFENALCDDYVTEKFYNALRHGLIPVVLGGADYTQVAPAGSYIDAQQFSGPAALAAHLLQLLSRPEELSRLRDWRRHYRVYSGERELSWWPCELCQRLHARRARVRRRDLYGALADPRQCRGSWEHALAARHVQRAQQTASQTADGR